MAKTRSDPPKASKDDSDPRQGRSRSHGKESSGQTTSGRTDWTRQTSQLLRGAEQVLRALRQQLESKPDADEAKPEQGSTGGTAQSEQAIAYRYRNGSLEPIEHPDLYSLTGLLGVDEPLERLRANASAFCSGQPYLDVLLYGERGTGKSSALRGLLSEFHAQGLRLVELESKDLLELGDLFKLLRPRSERFVLICDDLSFEDRDPAVRRLKAVLDGGVERRPENVMIAVTSNRRRLLPERASDNRDSYRDPEGELHLSETVHEKLSLSDRFGLALAFWGFSQETYLAIVHHHARELGLDRRSQPPAIEAFALRFALKQGGRSGRTARQACIAMLQTPL